MPPAGDYSVDIIARLGEAFRFENLEWRRFPPDLHRAASVAEAARDRERWLAEGRPLPEATDVTRPPRG